MSDLLSFLQEGTNKYFTEEKISDSLWRRVNAPNVNFETIYGGKFTLSTQLIILNYPAILSHWRSSTVFLETSSFYKMVGLSIPPEISF